MRGGPFDTVHILPRIEFATKIKMHYDKDGSIIGEELLYRSHWNDVVHFSNKNYGAGVFSKFEIRKSSEAPEATPTLAQRLYYIYEAHKMLKFLRDQLVGMHAAPDECYINFNNHFFLGVKNVIREIIIGADTAPWSFEEVNRLSDLTWAYEDVFMNYPISQSQIEEIFKQQDISFQYARENGQGWVADVGKEQKWRYFQAVTEKWYDWDQR